MCARAGGVRGAPGAGRAGGRRPRRYSSWARGQAAAGRGRLRAGGLCPRPARVSFRDTAPRGAIYNLPGKKSHNRPRLTPSRAGSESPRPRATAAPAGVPSLLPALPAPRKAASGPPPAPSGPRPPPRHGPAAGGGGQRRTFMPGPAAAARAAGPCPRDASRSHRPPRPPSAALHGSASSPASSSSSSSPLTDSPPLHRALPDSRRAGHTHHSPAAGRAGQGRAGQSEPGHRSSAGETRHARPPTRGRRPPPGQSTGPAARPPRAALIPPPGRPTAAPRARGGQCPAPPPPLPARRRAERLSRQQSAARHGTARHGTVPSRPAERCPLPGDTRAANGFMRSANGVVCLPLTPPLSALAVRLPPRGGERPLARSLTHSPGSDRDRRGPSLAPFP